MKLGAITVGQSPREDVTENLDEIFGNEVILLEMGALDGVSYEEILAMAPAEEDYILVSRLRDGRSVTFAEKHILPRIQDIIKKMEQAGAEAILFFCTGEFPVEFESQVPLIFPNRILDQVVPLCTHEGNITVFVPSKDQVEQVENRWKSLVRKVEVVPVSPYHGLENFQTWAEGAKDTKGELFVLDCIGYTEEMKAYVRNLTGKPVILPRTLAARIILELA